MIELSSPFALRPIYSVVINGVNVSSLLSPRLIKLSVVDNPGFDADIAQLTIDDSDGLFAVPNLKAEMTVSLGYNHTGLVNKGRFIIDSVEFVGPPDRVIISGKSADFKQKFSEKRNESYIEKTIDEIVAKIAERHGYEYRVAESLKEIRVQSLVQKDESDANLLTRLAREYDAVGTIKMGKLLFLKAGAGQNASGEALPLITINKKECSQYAWQHNERDAYTGVRARYVSEKTGKRIEVLAGKEERTKSIRKIYKTEESALNAARAELERSRRGIAQFSASLSVLDMNLISESPVQFVGFKGFINNLTDYVATKVISDITETGLVGKIEASVLSYSDEN